MEESTREGDDDDDDDDDVESLTIALALPELKTCPKYPFHNERKGKEGGVTGHMRMIS